MFRFLNFSDNMNKPDNNCDRLWKIKTLFDWLIYAYAKFYIPFEYFTVDEIIVLLRRRVTFHTVFQENLNFSWRCSFY